MIAWSAVTLVSLTPISTVRARIRVNQMFLSQASPPIAALSRPFHDQTGSAGFGTPFVQDFSSVRIRTIPTGGSVVLTPDIETSKVI
jgi:hypothetical protein